MSSIDTSVIIENLTELLQNSVNMTSVFYDIFLNPTPMDVELKQYDSDNQLITVTIPNRAKDRKIALDGVGSPEGVITANIGAVYVDNTNQVVYFKATGSGNTGWVSVITKADAEEYIIYYLNQNHYMTEGNVASYLVTNKYVTQSYVASQLASYKPTIPMTTMPSAS